MNSSTTKYRYKMSKFRWMELSRSLVKRLSWLANSFVYIWYSSILYFESKTDDMIFLLRDEQFIRGSEYCVYVWCIRVCISTIGIYWLFVTHVELSRSMLFHLCTFGFPQFSILNWIHLQCKYEIYLVAVHFILA